LPIFDFARLIKRHEALVVKLVLWSFRIVCTNVDPHLIADQRKFKAKYLQNGEKNW